MSLKPPAEIGNTETPQSLGSGARDVSDARRLREEREAATRSPEQRSEAPRTRRSNLGGAQLKLAVNMEIPGYHLFWENDVDARLERLLGEGFEFVTPAEVGHKNVTGRIVSDMDVTDRYSKYVGTTDEGKPMRAFLLKCPNDLWEDIQYCINDLCDERDRDILESADRADDRYQPKGFSTKIKTGSR